MSASRRTVRVLLVAGILVGTVAAGAGVHWWRQARLDEAALDARSTGEAALLAEDWPVALDGFGRYLQRYAERGAGTRDYVRYARARRLVPIPNGKHLVGAIWTLRKALEIEPEDPEARRELLDLYFATGYATEALELIEAMLLTAPDDVALLRRKCDVLESRRQFAPCLAVSRRIDALAPDDIDGHCRTMRLLIALNTPVAELDAWITRVETSHASDPRFGILRAAALARRHGDAEAGVRLDAVVAGTAGVTDPRFSTLLVGELDRAGRFGDSLTVLRRTKDGGDAALAREVLRRLWYAGRAREIVATMSTPAGTPVVAPAAGATDAATAVRDPEVIALQALALSASGRPDAAEPLLRELAARDDAVGQAWQAFVECAAARSAADRGGAAARLSAAVVAVPESGLLRQALGDAYAALGETDLALEAWTAASARAPAWAAPLERMARSFVLAGREQIAAPLARAALVRSPDSVEAFAILVGATAAGASGMDERQVRTLLAAVRTLVRVAPERAEEVLSIEIGLLARIDAPAAAIRMREALAAVPAFRERTLLELAESAAASAAGLDAQFLGVSEAAHGVTPASALAAARVRVRGGDAASAPGEFNTARARAETTTTPAAVRALDWDLANAQLLDEIRHADAGPRWTLVADANPASLPAQLGALASEDVWKDRIAAARLIERLRGLTGEQGVTWRIARARWMLDAPGAVESDVAEAARLLNDVTRVAPRSVGAHALLARALERLGNLPGAEVQIRVAADLAPDDPWIALDVVRLAQTQGRPESAARELDRVLGLGVLAPAQAERAAWLLARSGDARRGAVLLEPYVAAPDASRDGVVLMARLLADLGETRRAAALCERLLGSSPDVVVAELAAGLHESMGQPAEAQAALARLDGIVLPAGTRELIRARHAAAWGAPGAATDWYRRAADAAPASAEAWTAWLSFAVSAGDAAAVTALLDDPRALVSEPVRFVAANRASSLAVLGDERLRALVVATLTDGPGRPVLAEAVRAAARGAGPGREGEPTRELRRLAEANREILALQLVAADLCAAAGDGAKACEISRRAMSEFPGSAAAARQAAEIHARNGRWQDVLDASRLWRQRARRPDPRAEVLAAEALTRIGRPGEAVLSLEPRVAAALDRRAENERLLLVYALALTRDGRSARAAALLADLAAASPAWRTLPLVADADALGDAPSADAWLRMCTTLVPRADTAGRVRLARAWGAAWERYSAPELLAGARSVLDEIRMSKDAPADAWFVSGSLAQRGGDLDAACRDYSEALRRDPGLVGARNNLAMAHADAGRWRDAVAEATKAAGAAPDVPVHLDTLAYALRKGREFARARASLEHAIRLDPANPRWKVSLAETFVEDGDPDAADRLVAQIEERSPDGPGLPASVHERLERLKRRQK